MSLTQSSGSPLDLTGTLATDKHQKTFNLILEKTLDSANPPDIF